MLSNGYSIKRQQLSEWNVTDPFLVSYLYRDKLLGFLCIILLVTRFLPFITAYKQVGIFHENMSQKRYIPPHKRGGVTSQQSSIASQLSPVESETEDREVVFTLKSKAQHTYPDIPVSMEEEADEMKSSPGILCRKFKLRFRHDSLRDALRWFRNIGRIDPSANIEFPSTLNKDQRKEIHNLANNFGLGTSSQGFGDKRFISVFTVEMATLGVGKIFLTPEEKKRGDEVWFLVQRMGEPYAKYSHNEINEMILAGSLDPALQDLVDKNQLLLEEEFEKKCKIDRSK